MLAQDDEDLQQRAIEKAEVPNQGEDDRAFEAPNSQVDNDWFYSANFTAFTEENVLQYIAEQDKIRMMSGRYGTCTEWDFILEGGKIKKGSQSGSGQRSLLRLGLHSPPSLVSSLRTQCPEILGASSQRKDISIDLFIIFPLASRFGLGQHG